MFVHYDFTFTKIWLLLKLFFHVLCACPFGTIIIVCQIWFNVHLQNLILQSTTKKSVCYKILLKILTSKCTICTIWSDTVPIKMFLRWFFTNKRLIIVSTALKLCDIAWCDNLNIACNIRCNTLRGIITKPLFNSFSQRVSPDYFKHLSTVSDSFCSSTTLNRIRLLCAASSTRLAFELMTSRSWEYISCNWSTCSNHSAISDLHTDWASNLLRNNKCVFNLSGARDLVYSLNVFMVTFALSLEDENGKKTVQTLFNDNNTWIEANLNTELVFLQCFLQVFFILARGALWNRYWWMCNRHMPE